MRWSGIVARAGAAVGLAFALGCASTGPATVHLTGTVDYAEDMVLPAGAMVTVALFEQRPGEAEPLEIARRVIETSEEPPIPFSVSLPGGGLDPDAGYSVESWIAVGRRPWFTQAERVPVLTGGHPDRVELLLTRVP